MKTMLTILVAVGLLSILLVFVVSLVMWFRTRPRIGARTRLTATGAMAIAVAVLMFIAGANTGTNLLYLLVAIDLAMLLVSVVAVDLNLRGLSVRRRAPVEVRVGAEAPIEFWLRNDRRRLDATGVVVEERPVDGLDSTREVGALFALVTAGKTARSSAAARFTRRGVVRLEGLRVISAHPFGFLEKITTIDFPRAVLVLPRVRPLRSERLDALLGASGEGRGHRWEGAEQTDRLRLLRDYRTGDSPRHVDWKRSARISRLTVREYDRPRARRRLIALRLFAGDPEEAIEDAVSLALALLAHFVERDEAPELLVRLPEPSSTGEISAEAPDEAPGENNAESDAEGDAESDAESDGETAPARWRGGALSVLDASRLLARTTPLDESDSSAGPELVRELRGARRRGLEVLTVTSAAPGDPRLQSSTDGPLLSARDGAWFSDTDDATPAAASAASPPPPVGARRPGAAIGGPA